MSSQIFLKAGSSASSVWKCDAFRHRDELAEAVSRAETLAAAREAKLEERLATSRAETERFKSQSVERFEETEASDRANRARADAALAQNAAPAAHRLRAGGSVLPCPKDFP